MSTPLCCQTHSNLIRRAFGVSRWILPTAILALLPKCPACLAGYVLLWTGMGLSMSAAGILRTGLLVVSTSMLALLAARMIRNASLNHTKENQRESH